MPDTAKGARVFDPLPEGVEIVRDLSSGASLLKCWHAQEHQRPTGAWIFYPAGREPGWQTEFSRELSLAEVNAQLPDGEVVSDYTGSMLCLVCKGDEWTTVSFAKAVIMIGVVPKHARPKSPFSPPADTLF